ncbi:MAG: hypothetical protein ACXWQQ_04880 [Pseudobdellovibrio sp.]
MFRILLSVSAFFFLNSCSVLNWFSEPKNFTDCNVESQKRISQVLDENKKSVLSCLKKYNRTEDAAEFEKITKNKAEIRCESRNTGYLVLGEHKAQIPELSFNSLQLARSSDAKLKSEVFHESLHWLGYEHAYDFDLTNIAEICCIEHNNKSCDLLKYRHSDWTDAGYLKSYAQLSVQYGFEKMAFKTSINAGLYWNKKNKKDQMYAAFLSTLEILNKNHLKKKFTRKDKKIEQNDMIIPQTLVVSQLVFKSAKIDQIKASKYLYNELSKRFYPYQLDQEKLGFYNEMASVIFAVLNKDPENLTKNWNKLKARSEYLCRDLTKQEITATSELLTDLNLELFNLKTVIPAGDFYEIATYWNKPCELAKSLRTGR